MSRTLTQAVEILQTEKLTLHVVKPRSVSTGRAVRLAETKQGRTRMVPDVGAPSHYFFIRLRQT